MAKVIPPLLFGVRGLCDFVKSFDYRQRFATFLRRIPEELIQQIVGNVLDLIDPVR
jgi:hypothetical protein